MIYVFEHPWMSGLFGDEEASTIWSPETQIKHHLDVEAAYTRALGNVGKADPKDAFAVASLIENHVPNLEELKAGMARDGLPIPELVASLKKLAGDHADIVHVGATSQDVLDTALALTLQNTTDLLLSRLCDLVDKLLDLEKRFGTRSMMGRTRMQAALPIEVSHRIHVWCEPLEGHIIQLENARDLTEKIQLGGPVGDGRQLGPDRDAIVASMAEELGLHKATSWHATRQNVVLYANILSLISGALGKFGQDIALMAQQGIDEVKLKGGGSSSAMAHKNNPILAELLVTLARFNATQMSGMHQALVHEQERSGAAWALEWMILPQMAITTARSLSAANDLCAQITDLGQP